MDLEGHCPQRPVAAWGQLGAASLAMWPGLAGPGVSVLDVATRALQSPSCSHE